MSYGAGMKCLSKFGQASVKVFFSGRMGTAVRVDGMTQPEDQAEMRDMQDEGAPAELVQDKMVAESILREATDAESNPNDQPGFKDGRLGGSDGEDRQGEPNNDGDSDLGGDARGGEGTERSGGVDGGPARTKPLPGTGR